MKSRGNPFTEQIDWQGAEVELNRLISYTDANGLDIYTETQSSSGLSLGWRIEIEVDLPIVAIIE